MLQLGQAEADPIDAGWFSDLTDSASESVAGSLQEYIDGQKKAAIAEAKRAVIPLVIGVAIAAGIGSALLVSLYTGQRKG